MTAILAEISGVQSGIVCCIPALVLLTSCKIVHHDPLFDATVAAIRDVEHPPTKIVGTWMDFGFRRNLSGRVNEESKSYYLFRPDGSGRNRQFTFFPSTGNSIEIEADVTWSYVGKNKWKVSAPSSAGYHVVSSNGPTMGHRPAVTEQVRFHEGRLYFMRSGLVVAPLEETEARAMIERIRAVRDSRPALGRQQANPGYHVAPASQGHQPNYGGTQYLQ